MNTETKDCRCNRGIPGYWRGNSNIGVVEERAWNRLNIDSHDLRCDELAGRVCVVVELILDVYTQRYSSGAAQTGARSVLG